MEKHTISFFIVLWAALLTISIVNGTRQEKEVTYQLIEKEQNALYRIQTSAMTAVEGMTDPWIGAESAIEMEVMHIENGIRLLTPSWASTIIDLFGIFIFGGFCYYCGLKSR